MKTAALYIRVSTHNQNTDTQKLAVEQFAQRRGFSETLLYIDEGYSGAKDRRPRLDDLMKDARAKRFDVVVVFRFDRFARSLKHLVLALEEFQALGISFISVSESIDTSTPLGRMSYAMIAAMAEFERSIIQERIRAGLDRARAEGKHLGRPKRIFDRDQVRVLREAGYSVRNISRILQIPKSSVSDAILAMNTPSENRLGDFWIAQ